MRASQKKTHSVIVAITRRLKLAPQLRNYTVRSDRLFTRL